MLMLKYKNCINDNRERFVLLKNKCIISLIILMLFVLFLDGNHAGAVAESPRNYFITKCPESWRELCVETTVDISGTFEYWNLKTWNIDYLLVRKCTRHDEDVCLTSIYSRYEKIIQYRVSAYFPSIAQVSDYMGGPCESCPNGLNITFIFEDWSRGLFLSRTMIVM